MKKKLRTLKIVELSFLFSSVMVFVFCTIIAWFYVVDIIYWKLFSLTLACLALGLCARVEAFDTAAHELELMLKKALRLR